MSLVTLDNLFTKDALHQNIDELLNKRDNIIFLDYDGVIRLTNSFTGKAEFNKECVKLLSKFCIKYDFRIVVISSWKDYYDYQEMLYESGLSRQVKIEGKTENFYYDSRDEEIYNYLLIHPYTGKFIIIDDEEYNVYADHQIRTYDYEGFTLEKYKEAEELLKK